MNYNTYDNIMYTLGYDIIYNRYGTAREQVYI